MKRFRTSIGMLLVILLTVSTISAEEQRSDFMAVVAGNNAFALNLYSFLKNEKGNIVLSPYSISTALAMTYAGARGETEKQMAKVMKFTLSQKELHPAFSSIYADMNKIQKKGNVKLLVANSLWPHKQYPFKKEFIGLLEKHYKTSVTPLDYTNATEEARRIINEWVEGETNDKIKDLIKPGILDALTRLVLVNAIYFKGNWESRFDKKDTRNIPFKITSNETVETQIMYQSHKFGYYADQDLQVLEMPYIGKELSMIVFLPRKVDGIAQLEKEFSMQNLEGWTSKLRHQKVDTWIPKFEMTSEFSLKETLTAMGMKDAFGMKADFSGMDGTKMLYISAAIHKAFVEVNEEGTEAAAATAVVIQRKSASMNQSFRADHPFLFIIRNNSTGGVLFIGRVFDPNKKTS